MFSRETPKNPALPEIPAPNQKANERLYYQMKMRRYYKLYLKGAPKNSPFRGSFHIRRRPTGTLRRLLPSGTTIFGGALNRKESKNPPLILTETTTKHAKTKNPQEKKKPILNTNTPKPSPQTRHNKTKALKPKAPYQRKHTKKSRLYSIAPIPSMDGRVLLKNTRPLPGFQNLIIEPNPKGPYRYYAPKFYQGIYLNNSVPRNQRRYKKLLLQAKKHGVNALVVDVQKRLPAKHFMDFARKSGFYLIARIVVYQGGLKHYPPRKKYIESIANLAQTSAGQGFMEIQLDYIRFSDYYKGRKISLKQRYRTVATILKLVSDKLKPLGIPLGADIFGRIPFRRHDHIGQNMEVFALYLDTLYPMLYPSHFYGDAEMQSKPYLPVYHGVKKSKERVGSQSRIIAYIQAFKMLTKKSRLNYINYIYEQMLACKDAQGAGFIAWNAGSSYHAFFRALDKFQKARTANQRKTPDIGYKDE